MRTTTKPGRSPINGRPAGLRPLSAPGLDAQAHHTTRRAEPSLPGRTSPHHTETPLTTTPGRPRAEAATTRRTGDWPVPRSRPELRIARLAEHQPAATQARARFHVVMGSIRAMLEEQPSPRAVRAASRRICNSIVLLADDIATGKQTGGDQ